MCSHHQGVVWADEAVSGVIVPAVVDQPAAGRFGYLLEFADLGGEVSDEDRPVVAQCAVSR